MARLRRQRVHCRTGSPGEYELALPNETGCPRLVSSIWLGGLDSNAALRFQFLREHVEAPIPTPVVVRLRFRVAEALMPQKYFRKSAARLKFHRHQRLILLADLLPRRRKFLPGPGEHQFFRRPNLPKRHSLFVSGAVRTGDLHQVCPARARVRCRIARFVLRETAHPFLYFFPLRSGFEDLLTRGREHSADFEPGFGTGGGACHCESPSFCDASNVSCERIELTFHRLDHILF